MNKKNNAKKRTANTLNTRMPVMNDRLETEIKFHLNPTDPMRSALLGMGAVCLGRYFESNICFDDKQQTLLKKKALLRLRKDQKCTLTFKSPSHIYDADVKVMKETEIEVNDFDGARKILFALGFSEVVRYEKWRETFSLENASVVIDSMPFGDFLEIEGEKPAILAIASEIGLPWKHRILYTYLEMFEILKARMQLPFSDLTFENFKRCTPDTADFIPLFYGPKRQQV